MQYIVLLFFYECTKNTFEYGLNVNEINVLCGLKKKS